MELILVRHGETDCDVKNVCVGKTDVPMNDKGLRQIQTLARVFHNDTINAIYSSPLKRAKDAAAALNKYHNLPIDIKEGLSERDYGHWENRSFAEIKNEFSEEYNVWLSDWQEFEIPMGESAKDVCERNVSAIKQIVEDNPKGKVIVVTHQDAISNIIAYFLDMAPSGAWHFKVKSGAMCRIEIDDDGYATMLSFNEI